jgi:hypothetical protein
MSRAQIYPFRRASADTTGEQECPLAMLEGAHMS